MALQLSGHSLASCPAQVLGKLAGILAVTALLARTAVPVTIGWLKARFSDELFQLAMVGYCMSCAWACGRAGLSHELGAFLAGIMVAGMENHASVASATEQARAPLTCVAPLLCLCGLTDAHCMRCLRERRECDRAGARTACLRSTAALHVVVPIKCALYVLQHIALPRPGVHFVCCAPACRV